MTRHVPIWAIVVTAALAGCGDDDDAGASWQVVHRELPGALMSVWGTSENDVWAVGGDPPEDDLGPMVLHFDGSEWTRLETGEIGDLWWVFGFAGGPVYMGGAGGMILRCGGDGVPPRSCDEDGAFTRMTTPGTDTVFGIWGASPTEMWAVGGASGGARGAFAWRLDGDVWALAEGFPDELVEQGAVWKVYGAGPDDVWLVGTAGMIVHWDGEAFTASRAGGESLFTVHQNGGRFVTVGGFGTGRVLELDGETWNDVSPAGADPLVGVCLTATGGTAVGQYGAVFERAADGTWEHQDTGVLLDETLHSVWIDPAGGRWAVGGQVFAFPLVRGVMLHYGAPVPSGGLQ